VKYLEALLAQAREAPQPDDFKLAMTADLLRDSSAFYRARIAAEWRHAAFGGVTLPRDLSPDMKCWGHAIDDEEVAYEGFHQHCRSEEYLFLEDDFHTGNFAYDYEWMTTRKLNALQFYHAVERRFRHATGGNTQGEDHVGEYRCVTDFVALTGASWKTSICLRAYKEYAGLHDASLVAVSLAAADRAAVVKMAATGIARRQALALFGKFLRAIAWTD
jgi:serine protease Do